MDRFLTTVLDWFVMEGGDVVYEQPDPTGLDSDLDPSLHEIRFEDFEVFIGPATRKAVADLEIAALIRPEIALEPESVQPIIVPLTMGMPDHLTFEFPQLRSPRNGSSVWLVTHLDGPELDGHSAARLRDLLDYARRAHVALA